VKAKLLFVSISLMGIFALWLMTGGQPGLVNDSAAYIGGAESLLSGHGYSFPYQVGEWTPITHYPPLFSLVIAAATWLTGLSAVQAAYVLNLLLFGLNITLTGLLAWRLTHQNAWTLAASVIAACAPGLLWTHAFALSEPLFLSLELSFLLTMCSYTRRFSRRLLVIAAVLACLAFLTRYAGAAFYLSGGLIILFFSRSQPWRQRLSHLGLFFAVSIPGALLLVLRNRIAGGTLANRQLLWHPPAVDKLLEGTHNLWGFFLPSLPPGWNEPAITVMLLAVLFVLLWVFVWQTRRPFADCPCPSFQSTALVAIHGSIYLVVVILTMVFFDASTVFETRILAPFGLCFLIGGVGLLAELRLCLSERLQVVPLLGGAALMCLLLVSGADLVRTSRWDGLGFSAAYWRNSDTFQALEALPEVNIYSTRPMGIYLLSGRPATFIPDDYNPVTGQAVPDHTDRIGKFRREVLQGQAVVVIFEYPSMTVNPYEVDWARRVTAGLPLLVMLPDGAILGNLDE
jgi:4-amino-4-deoxy-L-arabinose transferase-like glycosyltransferase